MSSGAHLKTGRPIGAARESGSDSKSGLKIRDGMIVRIREFYDEEKALQAAGLRE
jgi:ketosteroid isomerase-like protein